MPWIDDPADTSQEPGQIWVDDPEYDSPPTYTLPFPGFGGDPDVGDTPSPPPTAPYYGDPAPTYPSYPLPFPSTGGTGDVSGGGGPTGTEPYFGGGGEPDYGLGPSPYINPGDYLPAPDTGQGDAYDYGGGSDVGAAVEAAREAVRNLYEPQIGTGDGQGDADAELGFERALQQAEYGAAQSAVAAREGIDLSDLYQRHADEAKRVTLTELYGEEVAILFLQAQAEERKLTEDEFDRLVVAGVIDAEGKIIFDRAVFDQEVDARLIAGASAELEERGVFRGVDEELTRLYSADPTYRLMNMPPGEPPLTDAQREQQQAAGWLDALGTWYRSPGEKGSIGVSPKQIVDAVWDVGSKLVGWMPLVNLGGRAARAAASPVMTVLSIPVRGVSALVTAYSVAETQRISNFARDYHGWELAPNDTTVQEALTLGAAGYAPNFIVGDAVERQGLVSALRENQSWEQIEEQYGRPISRFVFEAIGDPLNFVALPLGKFKHLMPDVIRDAERATQRLDRATWIAESAAEIERRLPDTALANLPEGLRTTLGKVKGAVGQPLGSYTVAKATREADSAFTIVTHAVKNADTDPLTDTVKMLRATTYDEYVEAVGDIGRTRAGHRLWDLTTSVQETPKVKAILADFDEWVSTGKGDPGRVQAKLVNATAEHYRSQAKELVPQDAAFSKIEGLVNGWVKLQSTFYLSTTGYVVRNVLGNVLPIMVDGLMHPWQLPKFAGFVATRGSAWRRAMAKRGIDFVATPGGYSDSLLQIKSTLRATDGSLDDQLRKLGKGAPIDKAGALVRGGAALATGGITEWARGVRTVNSFLEQMSREWIMMRASERAWKKLNGVRGIGQGRDLQKGIYTHAGDTLSDVRDYLPDATLDAINRAMVGATSEAQVRSVVDDLLRDGALTTDNFEKVGLRLLVDPDAFGLPPTALDGAPPAKDAATLRRYAKRELAKLEREANESQLARGGGLNGRWAEKWWASLVEAVPPGERAHMVQTLTVEAAAMDAFARSLPLTYGGQAVWRDLLSGDAAKVKAAADELWQAGLGHPPSVWREVADTYKAMTQQLERAYQERLRGGQVTLMLPQLEKQWVGITGAGRELNVFDAFVETAPLHDHYAARMYFGQVERVTNDTFSHAKETVTARPKEVAYHETDASFAARDIAPQGGRPLFLSTKRGAYKVPGGRELEYQLLDGDGVVDMRGAPKEAQQATINEALAEGRAATAGMARRGQRAVLTDEMILVADPSVLRPVMPPDEAAKMSALREKVISQWRDENNALKQAVLHHGKASADWALHDYDKQFAWDLVLKVAMPWEFWMSRSAYKWALRIAEHPRILAQTLRARENMPAISEWIARGVESGDWEDRFGSEDDPNSIAGRIKATTSQLAPGFDIYFKLPIPGAGGKDSPWANIVFDPLSPNVLPYMIPLDPFESEQQRKGWGDAYDVIRRLPAVSPFIMAGLNASGKFGPDAQAMPIGQTGLERDVLAVSRLPWVRSLLNTLPGAWVPETGLTMRRGGEGTLPLPVGLWSLLLPQPPKEVGHRPQYVRDVQRMLDQQRSDGELSAQQLIEAYELFDGVLRGEKVESKGTPLEKALSIANTKWGWRAAGSGVIGTPVYLTDKDTVKYFAASEELHNLSITKPWEMTEWFAQNGDKVTGALKDALVNNQWDVAAALVRRDVAFDELNLIDATYARDFESIVGKPTFWADYDRLKRERDGAKDAVYKKAGYTDQAGFYVNQRSSDIEGIHRTETALAKHTLGQELLTPEAEKFYRAELEQKREELVARELLNFYHRIPDAYTDPVTHVTDWKAAIWAQEQYMTTQQVLPPDVLRAYLSDSRTPTEAVAEAWKDWAGQVYSLMERGMNRSQAIASLPDPEDWILRKAFDDNRERRVVVNIFERSGEPIVLGWDQLVERTLSDWLTPTGLKVMGQTPIVVTDDVGSTPDAGAAFHGDHIRISSGNKNAYTIMAETYHAVWSRSVGGVDVGLPFYQFVNGDIGAAATQSELIQNIMDRPGHQFQGKTYREAHDWQHILGIALQEVDGDWQQLPMNLHKYYEPFFLPGKKDVARTKEQVFDIQLRTPSRFDENELPSVLTEFLKQQLSVEQYLDWQQEKKIVAWKEGRGANFFAGSTNELVDSLEDVLSFERALDGLAAYPAKDAAYDAAKLALTNFRVAGLARETEERGRRSLGGATVGGYRYSQDAAYVGLQNEVERLRQQRAWSADMERWFGSKSGGAEAAAQQRIGKNLAETLPAVDLEFGALDESGNTIGLHIPAGFPNYYQSLGKQGGGITTVPATSPTTVTSSDGYSTTVSAAPAANSDGLIFDGVMYPTRSDPLLGRVAVAVNNLDRGGSNYNKEKNAILNANGVTEQQLDDYYKRNDTPVEMLERKLIELVVDPGHAALRILSEAGITDRKLTNKIWEETTVTPEMLVAAALGDPVYSARGITPEVLQEVLERGDLHVPNLQEWSRRNWTPEQHAVQSRIDVLYDGIDQLEAIEKQLENAVRRAPTSENAKAQAKINEQQAAMRREISQLRVRLEAGRQPNPITLYEGTPQILKDILEGKYEPPQPEAPVYGAPVSGGGGGRGGGGGGGKRYDPDGSESPMIEAYKRDLLRARTPKARQRLQNIIDALRAGLPIDQFIPRYGFGR